MMTCYILWYPCGGTRYARGGYYEFYPFTRDSLWPASALQMLQRKAARVGGWIETGDAGMIDRIFGWLARLGRRLSRFAFDRLGRGHACDGGGHWR